MKKATCLTDDQCWQSVLARDPNADGEFVFAVRTTGIFCRPSCR
ncbi:TPA: Ada metal-binding domain-containing protein, partial [Escherichia coli O103:H2]